MNGGRFPATSSVAYMIYGNNRIQQRGRLLVHVASESGNKNSRSAENYGTVLAVS